MSEHTHALLFMFTFGLCVLCSGPGEIWCFILQRIDHRHPHHPGKRVHGGFTQGRLRMQHLIQHISHHLNLSSLFEQAVEFADWAKAPFVFSFLMSCFMGYVAIVCSGLFSLYLNGNRQPILPVSKAPFCVLKVCSDVFHRPVQLL